MEKAGAPTGVAVIMCNDHCGARLDFRQHPAWRRWLALILRCSMTIAGLMPVTLGAPQRHGLIVVYLYPLEPYQGGHDEHLKEEVARLFEENTRLFKEKLNKRRYFIVEGDTLPDTPGIMVVDREVTIKSFYRLYIGSQPRYQITSLFEAKPDTPYKIVRDCQVEGRQPQCHLEQIFHFHQRRLQALAMPRNNRPKSYHLKYTPSIAAGTASKLECRIKKSPQILLKETITNLLEMEGWEYVRYKCQADYVINVEAQHYEGKLSLEIWVEDENARGMPWRGAPYTFPDDSSEISFCDFVSPTTESVGLRWLSDFLAWFKKQAAANAATMGGTPE